jgi:uncharacterized membrane protein YedE/YeeE
MRARVLVAGAAIGLVFGAMLSWSGMTSPEVLRKGLLFESGYLYVFFASAVITAVVGLRLVRGRRALLTGETVGWVKQKIERRHITGSVIFGIGWGVADACPGPIATQLGQGIWWSVFTLGGVLLGVRMFMRSQEETEPAADRAPEQVAAAR